MADALVGSDGSRRFGFLAARPGNVNPLDAFGGTARLLRSLRLKQWVGFTLLHPELASSMIIQDAHYLASSELYVAELHSGRLTQHARTTRGGTAGIPTALFGSRFGFRRPGYNLDYEFGPPAGTQRVHIYVAGTDTLPAVVGDLELFGASASAPLSVSARLDRGVMYTHKLAYPASGSLRIGTVEYVFDPTRDLAVLDEHHSFFPYRTTWTWGTFAQLTTRGASNGIVGAASGIVGANFCRRPQPADEPEESCLWTPGAVEPLRDITFSTDGRWHAASADGRLDVTFRPDGRKIVKHQLGLAAIDYVQFYGTYHGTLRGADTTIDIDGARGVWEHMDTRF